MHRAIVGTVFAALLAAAPFAMADTTYTWIFNVQDESTQKPVDGVVINFTLQDGRSGETRKLSCTTDINGKCSLEGTVTGGGIFSYSRANGTFTIAKEGVRPQFKSSGQQVNDTTRAIAVLVRPAPRQLSFRVVDVEGQPLEGVTISFSDLQKSLPGCTTDATGACVVNPDHDYTVGMATKSGYYAANATGTGDKPTVLQARISDAVLREAASEASVRCSSKEACDRVYATAQIFLSRNVDMKLQFSNDTITETFNPGELRQLGGRVTRAPMGRLAWEVSLALSCGEAKAGSPRQPELDQAENLCAQRRLSAYRQFRSWVQERAQ